MNKGLFKIDKKKLVISDMDGTLLQSDKSISQTTIETVFEMRKNDIDFTIATGRIYPTVYDTIEKLDIQKPVILCNGAIIQNPITQEIYFSKMIEQKPFYEMLNLIDKGDSFFYFYTPDSLICKEIKYTAKTYYDMNAKLKHNKKIKIKVVDDMKSLDIENACKIVVIEEDRAKLDKIKNSLKPYEEHIEIFSSYWNNIEIVAKGLSKGEGVKFVTDMLKYDRENIMCIGDEQNDESMLLECGFPVAMGNASKELKKIARYITDDNNNDGISKAIREFAKI